jgi:hypothetical protein
MCCRYDIIRSVDSAARAVAGPSVVAAESDAGADAQSLLILLFIVVGISLGNPPPGLQLVLDTACEQVPTQIVMVRGWS